MLKAFKLVFKFKSSINKLEHVPQNIICQHPKLLFSRKIHSKYLENIFTKRYRFIAENIKSVIAMATFLRALLSTSTMATSPLPPERFPFILLCRSSSNHHISSFNLALFILLSGFAFSTAMGESEMRIKIMRAIIQPEIVTVIVLYAICRYFYFARRKNLFLRFAPFKPPFGRPNLSS